MGFYRDASEYANNDTFDPSYISDWHAFMLGDQLVGGVNGAITTLAQTRTVRWAVDIGITQLTLIAFVLDSIVIR